MRIVAGIFKGRSLRTLGGSHTRPTAGKVREAVFSSLSDAVLNVVWLDLFAGSGAMGIEALSRGARFCYFVENNPKACAVINKNIAVLDLGPEKARLYCADADRACSLIAKDSPGPVDIAYLDPPYGDEVQYAKAIRSLQLLLAPKSLIIVEHLKQWQPKIPWAAYLKSRSYGITTVSYFKKGES